jgi:hypothetical protein
MIVGILWIIKEKSAFPQNYHHIREFVPPFLTHPSRRSDRKMTFSGLDLFFTVFGSFLCFGLITAPSMLQVTAL